MFIRIKSLFRILLVALCIGIISNVAGCTKTNNQVIKDEQYSNEDKVYEVYIGEYSDKTDEEIRAGKAFFRVRIEEADKNTITFIVEYIGENFSPIYTTGPITSDLKDNKCTFSWHDSWGNFGEGKLTIINEDSIIIKMDEQNTSKYNRASLDIGREIKLLRVIDI